MMSSTATAHREDSAPRLVNHEAVVPRRRKRQRRRRLVTFACIALAACLATISFGLSGGSSTTDRPVVRPGQTHKDTPVGRATSGAVIRGTLAACGRLAPVLTLHQGDGTVVDVSTWRAYPSRTDGEGRRILDFSFTVHPDEYYLTMNNEDQMPPRDRQIGLVGHQVFRTRIVACP
jgi:hypothetical protein